MHGTWPRIYKKRASSLKWTPAMQESELASSSVPLSHKHRHVRLELLCSQPDPIPARTNPIGRNVFVRNKALVHAQCRFQAFSPAMKPVNGNRARLTPRLSLPKYRVKRLLLKVSASSEQQHPISNKAAYSQDRHCRIEPALFCNEKQHCQRHCCCRNYQQNLRE